MNTHGQLSSGAGSGGSKLLYTGMFLAAALSPLGSTMIAVALPSISGELGISGGALTQWLVSSYLIVGIATMSPGGKLGDLFGHGRALVAGMAIYGIGSSAGFVFANLPSLAIARIAMAAGGAMIVPATMALLRNITPENRRGRTFGYFGSVMGTAAAIGPLVGGELTARFGWRAVFVANVPVILLALLLLRLARLQTVAAEQKHARPRFDFVGSAVLAGALTVLVIASQMDGTIAFGLMMTGVLLLGLFAVWERGIAEPVLNLRLFLRPAFAAGNAVVGLQNLAMYALLFQLPIFFEQLRGVKAGITGRTIIGMMIAMVVAAPLGGRLSERLGPRKVVLAGSISALAGLFYIGNFESIRTPAHVLVGLILMGLGLGLSSAPSQASAMNAVSRSEAGMAGGALSSARYIGGVIGISALGSLLEASATIESHTNALMIYGVALLCAALAGLILPGRPFDRPDQA